MTEGARSRWGGGDEMLKRGEKKGGGDRGGQAGLVEHSRKIERGEKITKYEIERGDRRDPRLR